MPGILKNLQKELAIFLICIAISTSILVLSQSLWQSSMENRQLAQSTLNQAKARYYTALDRKRLLEQFENNYRHLSKAGIVGDENRLNWVDVIESTSHKYQIPYLKYRIDNRKAVSSAHLNRNYPGIDVFKSVMTLEMQLLHEGDLYTVINSLDQQAKGLFDIQSCHIIRNSTQVESLLDSKTDKNFSAVCTLNWYTFKPRSRPLPESRNNRQAGVRQAS